jgi:hypothetical protein
VSDPEEWLFGSTHSENTKPSPKEGIRAHMGVDIDVKTKN